MRQNTVGKPKIRYIAGGEELLDEVEPLWQKLIEHMQIKTTAFKAYYSSMTFDKRKKQLLKKTANGEMHIAIASDEATGEKVGYCMSSLNDEKTGEIDSIYVATSHRGLGVGSGLMQDALVWMDAKGAESKIVAVGAGNENAFEFYGRFGFKPRKTVLEQT